MKTSSILASVFTLAALVGAACPAPTADQCDVGTAGCECTPGGACDPGLTCASNTCVDLGDGTGPGESDPSSTSASGDESGSDSGDGSSGSADPCAENGGEMIGDGFCFKHCTWDDLSPGYDLFDDCTALEMICRYSDFGSHCYPMDWSQVECSSDADCEPSGVCVTSALESVVEPYSYCKPVCATNTNCGSQFSCVETCPRGDIAPLGFCEDIGTDPYPFSCCEGYPDPDLC